jgi:hypothetical protein
LRVLTGHVPTGDVGVGPWRSQKYGPGETVRAVRSRLGGGTDPRLAASLFCGKRAP